MNHIEHRDPALYDLPPGEWLCKFCACQRLGVIRSSLKDAVDAHGIENQLATALSPSIKGRAAFFNKAHVLQAVIARGGGALGLRQGSIAFNKNRVFSSQGNGKDERG